MYSLSSNKRNTTHDEAVLRKAPNQEYLSTLLAGFSMSLFTCFMKAVVSASVQTYLPPLLNSMQATYGPTRNLSADSGT